MVIKDHFILLFTTDGPFLLLLVASLGSVAIAIVEIIHYTYKTSKRQKKEVTGAIGAHYYDIRQRL